MKPVSSTNGIRYVGDRDTMFVHDSWNRESENCLLDDLVDSKRAVRFEPDALEQAFNEGFDYCDRCVGKRELTGPETRSQKVGAASKR